MTSTGWRPRSGSRFSPRLRRQRSRRPRRRRASPMGRRSHPLDAAEKAIVGGRGGGQEERAGRGDRRRGQRRRPCGLPPPRQRADRAPSASPKERRAPQLSSAARRGFCKMRSRAAAWACGGYGSRASYRSKAACPSRPTARSWAPSGCRAAFRRRMPRSPRREPTRSGNDDERLRPADPRRHLRPALGHGGDRYRRPRRPDRRARRSCRRHRRRDDRRPGCMCFPA